MSYALNGSSTVTVRSVVTKTGTPITNTNALEVTVKELLVAAFAAIPNQSGGTATVAAIVTALKTLP